MIPPRSDRGAKCGRPTKPNGFGGEGLCRLSPERKRAFLEWRKSHNEWLESRKVARREREQAREDYDAHRREMIDCGFWEE